MRWCLNFETRQHTDPPPVYRRIPIGRTKLFPLDADLVSRPVTRKAFGAVGGKAAVLIAAADATVAGPRIGCCLKN
jgi:hypothetical protein